MGLQKISQTDRNHLLSAQRPVHDDQELCEATTWPLCQDSDQNHALTVLQYVNFINHRKIGQVKYSLI